ncbi:hypothetical protein M9H77_22433 [Catharanthus roseus]|uniref:Uncharacterized protein n=1 Tax=Catharanthus roseus TaxID=4058 RepID=A0ACC0AS77_CATRO|nr:hypothetical protein M9H77_22433 [Catharanthus roseus]
MPTDKEMMYEQGQVAIGAPFPMAPSEKQMEDISERVIVEERQIAYTNHLLHGAMIGSLGEVGISMSVLGSLEPPPDWQLSSYPSSEGMRGECSSNAGPRGEDDDHFPHA